MSMKLAKLICLLAKQVFWSSWIYGLAGKQIIQNINKLKFHLYNINNKNKNYI